MREEIGKRVREMRSNIYGPTDLSCEPFRYFMVSIDASFRSHRLLDHGSDLKTMANSRTCEKLVVIWM